MGKRYKVYTDGKSKVIVTSTFAGRTVRGVAKCSPEDKFDLQTGIELAQLRCDVKVAQKRRERASNKIDYIAMRIDAAVKEYEDAKDYYKNAYEEECIAQYKLDDFLYKEYRRS